MIEPSIHLITECPGYIGLRKIILGRPTVQEDSIYKILKLAEETER